MFPCRLRRPSVGARFRLTLSVEAEAAEDRCCRAIALNRPGRRPIGACRSTGTRARLGGDLGIGAAGCAPILTPARLPCIRDVSGVPRLPSIAGNSGLIAAAARDSHCTERATLVPEPLLLHCHVGRDTGPSASGARAPGPEARSQHPPGSRRPRGGESSSVWPVVSHDPGCPVQ